MSATSNVVSTTIVIEWGESDTNRKIQYLVYFISEVLSDYKTLYFHIMKLSYVLPIISCKLSHYFQAHQIEVHTSSTLGEILNNREATVKNDKWAIELSMHEIVYKTRTTIKPSEQRLKHLSKKERWNIGPSIWTVLYNFKA
jgi:hypothetical protein